MMRQKLGLFVLITAVFLGAVLLLYNQRTGSLTIFGDASALAASVTVSDPVDLEKGVTAGNGNAQVVDGAIVLLDASSTRPGTAQFDIGSPEVTQFQRFRSLQPTPAPPGTEITLQLAGSLDGISFRSLGSPISLVPDQRIDLTVLIPSGSHYLRIITTLKTTTVGVSPRFAGFGLDYEVLGDVTGDGRFDASADTATLSSATNVTVNGTLTGSTDADTGNKARRAATQRLAGTGIGGWLIGLTGLWLLLTTLLFALDPTGHSLRRR